MKFDIDYYFEEIEENEMFFKLTNKKQNVMEIFDLSSKIIDEIETNGKQEIYTNKIQENVKPANKKVIGFNFILIVVIFVRIIHLYDKCRWYRQYN